MEVLIWSSFRTRFPEFPATGFNPCSDGSTDLVNTPCVSIPTLIISCFNPCSDGSTDLVAPRLPRATAFRCFNPCSDGSTDLVRQ